MRKNRTYCFDVQDMVLIRRMEREADRHRPKISRSQFLIEIIRRHFEHEAFVREINSMKSIGDPVTT